RRHTRFSRDWSSDVCSSGLMGKARPGSELETLARNAAEHLFLALDSRVQAAKGGKALLRKAFPGHWSFLLGELALYSLVVLLLKIGRASCRERAGDEVVD